MGEIQSFQQRCVSFHPNNNYLVCFRLSCHTVYPRTVVVEYVQPLELVHGSNQLCSLGGAARAY